MATKIIIDTDPGCDDAIALIAALKSPLLDVRGITSIGGNVSPLATQHNARAICALVGREDVFVYAGSDRPLQKQGQPLLADHIHGEDGLHGLRYPKLPSPPSLPPAHEYMIEETYRHTEEPLNIVAIGPTTNIGTACLQDPDFSKRVGTMHIMGGAIRGSDDQPMGNITPYAEFNVHCDPHAAQIVFSQMSKIVMTPINVSNQTVHDKLLCDWMRAAGGERGANIANMLEAYARSGEEQYGSSALHDFNTIAGIVDPAIYTYRRGNISVATTGEREGETTFTPDPQGNVFVADSVDLARYKACMKRMLGAYVLESP